MEMIGLNIHTMLRRVIIVLAVLATFLTKALGQQTPDAKPYTVGDTLPDLPLGSYLMNFGNPQATLNDFRGKYVILDFWETFCQPCINALPKVQALQDRYGDEMQFIAVTSDTEKNVRRLLSRSEVIKDAGIAIPFAVQDSVLRKAFPHRIIPHVIVISPEGVVQGITHGEEITDANMAAMLSGSKTDWLVKDDGIAKQPDPGNDPDRGVDSMLLWSAQLKKGAQGRARITRYEQDRSIHTINLEVSPLNMFYKVFSLFTVGVMGNINPQRLQVDIKDPATRMRYANKDLLIPFLPNSFPYLHYANRMEYEAENLFSYNASFPPATPDSLILTYVFQDLNKAWPIKGEIVSETKRCYLIRADKEAPTLLESKGGEPIAPFNHTTVQIKNQPISEFVKVLAWFADGPPIFDESGIEGPIDIEIDFSQSELRNPRRGLIVNNPLDMVVLEKELKRYGLYLVEEEREVPVLRIYDEVPGNEKTASRPLK